MLHALTLFDRDFRELDRLARSIAPWAGREDDAYLGWIGRPVARRWPRTEWRDEDSAFVLDAEVPGFGEKDVTVTATADTVTIAGARKAESEDGGKRRLAAEFTRSFSLPVPVDPERTTATLKDGILTVRIEKKAELQPRTIEVKAA